jgi:hypothetical protein
VAVTDMARLEAGSASAVAAVSVAMEVASLVRMADRLSVPSPVRMI